MQLPMHSVSTSTPCYRNEEFEDWLQLIRSEYAEMPGLHLSKRQAQRLWGLDAERCQSLLDTLESSHYLKRTEKDMYIRADIGVC